jgi:hypothetical protein
MTDGWNYADLWEAMAERFPDEVVPSTSSP